MSLPNFFIVGAMKAGTTSLYHYLRQHPEIFLTENKEPGYFHFLEGVPDYVRSGAPGDDDLSGCVTDYDAYCHLFHDSGSYRARGEASTIYLYDPKVPRRIKAHCPQARIIAILRNPVDRAFSNFLHMRRIRREMHASFRRAVAEEESRIGNNWGPDWHYLRRGFYFNQCQRWIDTFDPARVFFCLTEELESNPLSLLQDIFSFLGVDTSVGLLRLEKHNASRMIQAGPYCFPSNRLETLLRTRTGKVSGRAAGYALQMLKKVSPRPSRALRRELLPAYRADVQSLQSLINKDLTSWLRTTTYCDPLQRK